MDARDWWDRTRQRAEPTNLVISPQQRILLLILLILLLLFLLLLAIFYAALLIREYYRPFKLQALSEIVIDTWNILRLNGMYYCDAIGENMQWWVSMNVLTRSADIAHSLQILFISL